MTVAPSGQLDFGAREPKGNGRQRPHVVVDMQKLFDRLPPHSLEAEMALLGSLILDPKMATDVLPLVSSGKAFYKESHGAIFDAIVQVYDRHQSGDLVQLVEALRERKLLDDVGGNDYLIRLAEGVPSAVNAVHYARIVRDRHQLRSLIDTAGQILYDAYNSGDADAPHGEGARAVLDLAEQKIFDIAQQTVGSDAGSLRDLLQQAMDLLLHNEGRAITGLDTGFYELSEMTSGLQPGELIIVAGRPSMGKTSFALNLAEQIALGGQPHAEHGPHTPVAIFSMEMSRQSLVQRLLCAHAGVDSHRFRTNRLTREEFKELAASCDALSHAPIFIDDTPGLTILMLRAKARRLVAQHGVKCIVIDYLQLMSSPSSARDGRQQEVSAISRGVKALARELNVPVVCLSQLNRGPEDRVGNRPRMSDLRESGSIEQDADVVMLLHREDYYHQHEPGWAEENPDKVGVAEVIIAKQRNGPTGTVELTWDNKTTRFLNKASSFRAGDAPATSSRPPTPAYTPPPQPSPFPAAPDRAYFSPGRKSGPEEGFRDGGGPDRDDDAGLDEPAPF